MKTMTKRIPVPDNWKDLKPHPLSKLIAFGTGISTIDLAGHMREHGYDAGKEIVLFEDMILDGRHRHVAAQEAEVTPTFAVFVGGDPIPYVRQKLLRQHLTESQRGMLAAALIKAAKDNEVVTLPPTQLEAATAAGVSKKTVTDSVKVTDEGGEKLKSLVTSGQTAVSVAATVTRSVFCSRCQRVGVIKNCSKCQELRARTALAAKKGGKLSRPKRIGSEKFDWRGFDTHFGFCVRGIDAIKKAYGGDEAVECEALLRQFRKVFTGWKKRVTAS